MAEEKKKEREKIEQQEKERKKQRRAAKPVSLPKGKKLVQAVSAAAFLGSLVVFCAAGMIHKDQTFSNLENRMLAQKPEISWTNIVSGRFMKQYEEYQSDQFPGRNFWIQIKTMADTISGKREENGVFNARDDYLMADIAVPDKAMLEENLTAMKEFAVRYQDVGMHIMLVPNSANIYKSKLPALAVTADQGAMLDDVRSRLGEGFDWIDTEKTMKEHRDEEIYYHTDHHWTTLGAYYAFQDAKEQLGIAGEEQIKMKAYGVSNNFNGTLSAMSGYQTGYKEAIYIYLPEGEKTPEYVVNYVEEQKKTGSLYDSSKLDERDQYGVFLGGNHALVEIKTTAEQGKRLLIIKDSYANCFIPFLVPYYREIMVMDPRYYSGDIEKLMTENRIDSVLFLYNANTFFEDRMLAGVLAEEASEESNMEADEGAGNETPENKKTE